MANMPWKPAKPGRPAVKGRDANAPRSMTTPPRRGRPKNKSIVPKKPDGKNQDPKATPKQGGGNRRLERTARRLTRAFSGTSYVVLGVRRTKYDVLLTLQRIRLLRSMIVLIRALALLLVRLVTLLLDLTSRRRRALILSR